MRARLSTILWPAGGAESGQAAAEMAITLVLFLSLIFATMAIVGWYFSQSAAAVSAATAARASGTGRGDLARGQQENERVLRGVVGSQAGSYLANDTQVSVDALRRAVIVRVRSGPTIYVPIFGSRTFEVFGGSFTRNWQFFGGPPNPWE